MEVVGGTSSQVGKSHIKKSGKNVGANGEDRLSHLPQGLISNILSRLFTEDAVRTSILSKDWEYKWTSISNINISDSYSYDKRIGLKTSFLDFVDRVLFLSQNIKAFRLSHSNEYNLSSRLATWITTLLRRNVEILEIRSSEEGIVLPRSLLNNSSLRELNLSISCTFKVPSENSFANLKCLHLVHVEILKELSSTNTLIFNFPVLETFEWRYCKWMNVKTVEISAPSLTSLVSETDETHVEILDYSIKIFGQKLVYFESCGGSAENIIVAGPPVVKAVLHHEDPDEDPRMLGHYGLQFRSLLKEFSSVEDLRLTFWVAKVIANTKQELALPRFYKLRELLLDLGTDIDALLELLHSAPYLTILTLVEGGLCDDYDFDAVESVPSCIVSHLEVVDLRFYSSASGLATFLLKNGVKLRKFRISRDTDVIKKEIMKKVSTFPKASASVSVVVY